MKATHNSYHVARPYEPLRRDPQLRPDHSRNYTHAPLYHQLEEQGVRSLELDVHYRGPGVLLVYHSDPDDNDTTCLLFKDCLHEIRRWSEAHPHHHPLLVMVEAKTGFHEFGTTIQRERALADLEHEIHSVWTGRSGSRLLTPDDVRGSSPSLPDALRRDGWPALEEVRQRVMFVLLARPEVRSTYTHGDQHLRGRLMFVSSSPGEPFGAVALVDDPTDKDRIEQALAVNFLVRTRADADNSEPLRNDTARRDAALKGGSHVIATDYPVPRQPGGYHVTIEGGTPSRCNPVTAPPWCRSAEIE